MHKIARHLSCAGPQTSVELGAASKEWRESLQQRRKILPLAKKTIKIARRSKRCSFAITLEVGRGFIRGVGAKSRRALKSSSPLQLKVGFFLALDSQVQWLLRNAINVFPTVKSENTSPQLNA